MPIQWTSDQLSNAKAIIQTGQQLGASRRDILIALMTAATESGLRNVPYGDRDSVGLFQQRAAWGTYAQRTDPREAARMFFQGGHGGQRGLFDFKNRDQMTLGQAAQAVQVSAYPDRYAGWGPDAKALLKKFGVPDSNKGTLGEVPSLDGMTQTVAFDIPSTDTTMPQDGNAVSTAGTGLDAIGYSAGNPLDAVGFGMAQSPEAQDPMADLHMPTFGEHGTVSTTFDPATGLASNVDDATAAEGWRKAVIRMAHKALGTPYVWGGTNLSTGVDCSGLVQSIYNQLGFKLPRVSADQARSGQRLSLDQLKPGDLVAVDNSSRNQGADHIAIYIGGGHVIEAPRPGGVVEVGNVSEFNGGWGVRVSK